MKMTKTVMVAMVAVVTALATATETEDSTPLDTTGGHTINVAAGDTLVYSGKITGSGRLTKTGGGTLRLTNSGNDFTGGISVSEGYVDAAVTGCLGTGNVYVQNSGVGGMIFSGGSATFSNTFMKTGTGEFIYPKADTEFTGNIISGTSITTAVGGANEYLNAGEGARVVFKGTFFTAWKPCYFRDVKGTFVFEGPITSYGNGGGFFMETLSGNVGGKAIYCNQANQLRILEIGNVVHVCSNENVLAGAIIRPRGSDRGYVDLNGFDQSICGLHKSGAVLKYNNLTNALVLSAAPATLTMTGTVAGAMNECNCLFDGKISLVLDADPTYTNQFVHRISRMDGDISVKSGVFHIAGENTQFPKVPKISVEENGAFVFSSSYVGKALPSVTNLTLAGSSRFEIINDTLGKHHLPFTQNQLHLALDTDSTFRLMDDLCLTVQTFRVGRVYQHKGKYTSSKCPAIKSGTVIVLNGPKYGIVFTVR